MGSENYIKKTELDLDLNPIVFNDFELKVKCEQKYLGQILCANLSMSAYRTVKERENRIKGATLEIKSIVDDFRMQRMAGLVAAWELWERALLPSLLAGAGSWIGNIDDTVDLCNKIQNFYWRTILEVPISCPKIALQSETNMIDMKLRIWKLKCLLLIRLKNLDDDSLAKEIWIEERKNNWPGIGRGVSKICEELKISDINTNVVTKKEVDTAIKNLQIENLKKS